MKQHRTIGLVGGMSWESTALYYRLLNEGMQARLGGHNNARSVLVTVNFEEVLALGMAGRWDAVGARLGEAAQALARAGADVVLLTANTAHVVADHVREAVDLPLLHIGDVTGAAVRARGFRRVGLMGTRPTLEGGFYVDRLAAVHGVEARLPDEADRERLNRIILDELSLGSVRDDSRRWCLDRVARFATEDCEAVVLACTELPLLLGEADTTVPLFDTTRLHVDAAIAYALDDGVQGKPERTE